MRRTVSLVAAASGLAVSSVAMAQVLGGPHITNNFVPFGSNQSAVTHQVFRSGLFSTATRITSIGFAPGLNGPFAADVEVRLGYTNRVPNQPGPGGLDQPLAGGGGQPNASGPVFTFFDNPTYSANFTGASTTNFQMDFANPAGFVYFPGLDNLLVEVDTIVGATTNLGVSRADPNADTSRAFVSTAFSGGAGPLGGLRTEFVASSVVPTILPTWPHATGNRIPTSSGATATHHQVYMAPTLTPMSAGGKLAIQALRHAPTNTGSLDGSWRVNMGYTSRRAGFLPAQNGLNTPVAGGGGAPNASGPMTTFLNRANFGRTFTSADPENFQLELRGRPFIYDPALGNLLVEYVTAFSASSSDVFLSRTDSNRESTRDYIAVGAPAEGQNTRALRTEFVATRALEEVKPNSGHVTGNFIPFGLNQDAILHQVFASSQFGTAPVRIHSIAFAPDVAGVYTGNVTIRLGYTNRVPGVLSSSGGLSIPNPGGGGAPNASLPMTTFRSGLFVDSFVAPGTENFQMVFTGDDAFRYNPALGNLLVEIVAQTGSIPIDVAVSRAGGGPLSSRAFRSSRFPNAELPTQATRMLFTYFVDQLPCEADLNADGVVDFNDFLEFLNLYNASNPLVDINDDGVVDFNDLLEYLNQFNLPC